MRVWRRAPSKAPFRERRGCCPARVLRAWLLLLILTALCKETICFLVHDGRRFRGPWRAIAKREIRPKTRWLEACSSLSTRRSSPPRPQAPLSSSSPPPSPQPHSTSGGGSGHRPPPSSSAPRRPQTFQARLNRKLVDGDPETILTLVEAHAEDMNAVNCATALHRLSRRVSSSTPSLTSDRRFLLLLTRTEATLPYSNPQALSNTLHALAHLDHHPGASFLTLLLHHAVPLLPSFTPQALSLTMSSLATFRHVPTPLFLTRFYGAALSHLHSFTAQGLSMLLHSLATLPLASPPPSSFLQPAVTHFWTVLLPTSSPTSLSLFASSLPILEAPHNPDATAALLVTSLPLLPSFQAQDCVLLLQGLSKLHASSPPPSHLLTPLLNHINSLLPTFSPVALPILLLALTRLRLPLASPLQSSLTHTLTRQLPYLTPGGIITCLYSLHRLRCPLSTSLLDSSLTQLHPNITHLDLHDASHLLMVLSSSTSWPSTTAARQGLSRLLHTLTTSIRGRLVEGTGLDLSTIVSSMARLGHHPGQAFIDDLLKAAGPRLKGMAPSALANLLYGLSKLLAGAGVVTLAALSCGGAFLEQLYESMEAARRAGTTPFSRQDVAHIIVALGRMRARPPAHIAGWLVGEVEAGLMQGRRFNRQDLAAIVQGMGSMDLLGLVQDNDNNVRSSRVARLLAADVRVHVGSFSAREAAGIIVGYSRMMTTPAERDVLATLISKVEARATKLSRTTSELSELQESLCLLGFEAEWERLSSSLPLQGGKGPPREGDHYGRTEKT